MNDAHAVLMPKARKDQLIIKELPDETLVYDLESDKAHCLNDTAAKVWKNCDGKNSVTDISTSLAKETGASVDERVIWLALDQLEKLKLLEKVPIALAVFAGMNRRQLMRNLGVAAIALPLIVSIAAPTAQAQGSSISPAACAARDKAACGGTPCSGGGNCHKSGNDCIC